MSSIGNHQLGKAFSKSAGIRLSPGGLLEINDVMKFQTSIAVAGGSSGNTCKFMAVFCNFISGLLNEDGKGS